MKASLNPFFWPFLRETSAGLFLKLVEAILELMLPILLAQIIDIGIAGRDIPYIYGTGARMLILIVIGLICAVLCQYCAAVAAQGFGHRLRTALFRHINRLSVSEQRRVGPGSLLNRVTSDVERLQLAVSMIIRLGSRIPFVVIGAVVASMFVDLPLSSVILVGSVAFLAVAAVIVVSVFPIYSELQKRLDRIRRVLRESISGVRVIRAFRRRDCRRERFDAAVDEHERSALRAARISSFMQPSTQLIMNLAICGILWFGAGRVDSGNLTTGQIVALINYVLQILVALVLVANLTVIFTRAAASRERVLEVLSLPIPSDIASSGTEETEASDELQIEMRGNVMKPDDASAKDAIRPDEEPVALEFRNVTLHYPGEREEKATRAALSEIAFRVEKNRMLAVTGTTGSGKSSLVALMLRLEEPTEGRILIDGIDIARIPRDELRRRISVVHQSPRLFAGTIEENLRWGLPDADEREIEEALRVAQAREFVEKLPEGTKARVERGGRNFSGGQRQRLAIARSLVKRSELLVLDDSASALDYLTESKLYRALTRSSRATGRTLVVISQRIAAIRKADYILVLDEGRQVGFGTHDQLLAKSPEYKAIAESQLFGKEAK